MVFPYTELTPFTVFPFFIEEKAMDRCTRCSGEMSAFAVFCPHCAQATEPDFDRLIGITLENRCRIYRRLGKGGLSTVFAATDLPTDRIVAIKVSDPAQLIKRDLSYALNEAEARHYWAELLERMRKEAEVLSTIEHPGIVRIYGTGMISEDIRFATMEFLRGRTLREELDEEGRMEITETVRLLLEAADALAEVHARGIVHRDINPKNIFLCGASIKLIDFGIAKFPQPEGAPPFTRHSLMSGTVAYASPEQCQGYPIDHRSDIYSLGIVAYEMLTGTRPFQGRTPTEIALKQIQAQPTPPRSLHPEISISMEQTILRALEKDPERRHQSIEDFANELKSRSNQIVIPLENSPNLIAAPIPAAPDGDPGEPTRSGRQWRRATAGTAILLAGLIGAGLAWDALSSGNAPVNDPQAGASPSPSASGTPGSDADALELAARLPQPSRSAGAPRSSGNSGMSSAAQAALGNSAPLNDHGTGQAKAKQDEKSNSAESNRVHTAHPDSRQNDNRIVAQQSNTAPPPSKHTAQTAPDVIQEPPQPVAQDRSERSVEPPARESYEPGFPPRGNDRIPESRKRTVDETTPAEDEDNAIPPGPKLIQWSGPVNGARELKIELPGVPGRVEIPRVYRDRVGIIEPPNADNDWRCATVRVFGRGQMSFVMRWWPLGNRGRDTARR
jgi:serine/threonine protein kinase